MSPHADTAPGYPEYVELRAAAEAAADQDGRFVDPRKLLRLEQLPRSTDWRTAVIGHTGRPDLVEMHALLIAHEWNLDPPLPGWLTFRRAAEAARREAERAAAEAHRAALRQEWRSLHTAFMDRFGAVLQVAYNYSGPHHYELHTSGADHIILTADLAAGRLVRKAGWALCTTPSSRRRQSFDSPDPADQRWPTCRACIRALCRLLERPEPETLIRGKAGDRW